MPAADPKPPSLVGRQEDERRLANLLLGGARIVTVVGPPGVGKSTLVRAATDQTPWPRIEVGVGDALDEDEVLGRVARALELELPRDTSAGAMSDAIGHLLSRRGRTLLVLDDFDGFTRLGPTLKAWSEVAPSTRIAVSSCEPLRLREETVLELEPLPEDESLALFESRSGSAASEADPARVRELVQRLEGLPLAIELAAARSARLSVDELLERLTLAGSRRPGVSGPHRSLLAALEVSWELLPDRAQHALARFSLFHDGFDLDNAGRLLDPPAQTPETLELLESLTGHALVQVDRTPGRRTRFRLLDTVRDFARARLEEGDVVAARRAHAETMVAGAESAAAQLHTAEVASGLAWLSDERGNLLAVCRQDDDPALSVRAAIAMANGLRLTGPARQGVELLQSTLDRLDSEAEPELFARALAALATSAAAAHDLALAEELGEGALALTGDLGLVEAGIEARLALARVAYVRGDLDRARRLFEEALTDTGGQASLGYLRAIAHADLGTVCYAAGETDDAEGHYREALELFRSVDARWRESNLLSQLGLIAMRRGNLDEAESHYRAALAIIETAGVRRYQALCQLNLAIIANDRGDDAEAARQALIDAVDACRRCGFDPGEAHGLTVLAEAWEEAGDFKSARNALREARDLAEGLEDASVRASVWIHLGRLALHEGNLDGAIVALEEGCHAAELSSDATVGALAHGYRAAARALAGDLAGATSDLEAARSLAAAEEAPHLLGVIAALAGIVADAGGPPPFAASPGPPTATRRLAGRIRELWADRNEPRAPGTPGLLIGAEARWFRIGDGERVDLSQRPTLSRVLDCLAVSRLGTPGDGLSAPELFTRAWPGEQASRASAGNRVRVAISTLRSLGLRAIIERVDSGYRLDPEVRLVRA